MTNLDELKRLIEEAPSLPWSGPTDSEEGTPPDEYAFRDADGDYVIAAYWYDGPVLGATIETERLVVLGLNSLPELIRRIEIRENENTILREELEDCRQRLESEGG